MKHKAIIGILVLGILAGAGCDAQPEGSPGKKSAPVKDGSSAASPSRTSVREGVCNCCQSSKEGVVFYETTFHQAVGRYRAGEKVVYGVCPTCRRYCGYPHSTVCTLRSLRDR